MKSTSKVFKFSYFMSSFMITYLSIIITLAISNFDYYRNNLMRLWQISNDTTGLNLVNIILLILLLISLISLVITKNMLLNTLNYTNTIGTYKVVLGNRVQYDMKQIAIIEIIIPVIFTLILHQIPLLLIILLVFWQTFRYLTFHNMIITSNRIYHNSGLFILGYRYYSVDYGQTFNNDNHHINYVLVNIHQLNIKSSDKQVLVVPLASKSNIAIID